MKAVFCKLCRLSVAPGHGTTMQAFGRPLFVVHREPCAATVNDGMRVAMTAALSGVRTVLASRSPRTLLLLEQGARFTRSFKETTTS